MIDYISRSGARIAAVFTACIFAATALCASDESLAETGGCVPVDAPALAFKDVTLAELGVTRFPSVMKSGGWAGAEAEAPLFCRTEELADGALASVTYQAQWYDGGYIKAATIKFTEGDGGVYAQLTGAKAIGSGVQAAYGTDFTGNTSASPTAAADGEGYALRGLRLSSVADVDSINLNFYHSTYKLYGTANIAPAPYTVNVKGWSQMVGQNGSLSGLTLVGDDNGTAFYPALAATATIAGTRGTWSNSQYSSTEDVRYGYIDENENNTTPSVTISNVPFEFYKVVFYASTDTANSCFGYVTVNDRNYTSGNSEKDDAQSYATIEGTAAWGKTRVADYIEGVNYLVTPVIPATADGSVKVVGHKQDGRGCIAAIQIVKATAPEIAATAITAADINAAVPSGESVLKIPADATITLDAALTASKVKFVCSGKVTLSAASHSQPSAEELAKLDFTYVKGAVLRSWLTPGVVGFNFNADGGLENNGTEDSCSDTSLALEIGTWYKNGHNQSGSSTEMFADGLSTLTWASRNVYAEAGDIADGTFIQGYLDDGQNVSITLSAVPYETYDLIIYCSTDNSDKGFKAKTVNGTIYTWDSATGAVTTTTDANAVWGLASLAAGKAVYGANTIRINGLSGALSILGGTNSDNGRGCISAIQIMPAGTSTAPTMTVGAVGEATAATWTDDALWEGGVVPSSGTAKLIVSGDVTLTIDDDVSLSAVTVEGAGTLTLVEGEGKTVEFDSLSSQVQVILPDDSVSIATLSAPVKYLYKTGSLVSTTAGNTYTQGEGTSEAAATIAHNGGSATLTGGTYYLGESMNDTATTVDFVDAAAVYSSSSALSVGMATYIIEGTSSITTPRIVLSNGGAGRTSVMTLKDTASLTVTGGVDGDTNQGNMFGHYAGPSTFTIQDSATFTSSDYIILIGRTGNTQTININGGVFTAKGLMLSGYASGTNTLNLNGGVLALGESGIGTYGASRTMAVNVLGASEVRATAATLPVTQAVTLSAPVSFTKASGVDAATVTLASVSGAGAISVGAGVTLNIGKNRPTGEITVDDDGVLVVVMADKSDVPVLHVTAQPATVKLYAPDGVTEYADATVEYDAEAGTITITSPRPVWNAKEDSSFGTVGNWSTGALPENGQDVAVNFASDTDMTVSGSYTLGDLAFTGAGDATISGSGSIAASAYDFSGTTGRVEYNLPTGEAPVTSGSNTLLLGGGSGAFSVADGKMLTLGPWGTAAADGITYEFLLNGGSYLTPAAGSTLVFSPGEGNVQKTASYDHYHSRTTIVITNGTYVAYKDGGGDGFFGSNSIRIDNGGVLSLENATDLTGYNNTASTITINEGGTLQVKMRDTLRRPVVLNGGTITVQNAQGNAGERRALDFHDANTITVHANSTIQAIAGGVEDGTGAVVDNPEIYFRGLGTTINIDDGVSLVNNVTYRSYQTGTVIIRGTMNKSNGNGRMVMNGFNGNPLVFAGTATVGEQGKPVMYELNCEHQNGTYVVNANSRLLGRGSVTGNGGVTLAAANSKFCGSLTVDNLVAANGATYGDQWNPAGNKVAATFEAAGTQTVSHGTFTIGKDVAFKETVTTTTYTNNYALDPDTNQPTDTIESVTTNTVVTVEDRETLDRATFNIAATGNLKLERNVAVAGLVAANGATITLGATRTAGPAKLTVNGTATFAGTLNIVLDYGTGVPTGGKFKILESATLPDVANIRVTDKNGVANWHVTVKDGAIYAENRQGFAIHLF